MIESPPKISYALNRRIIELLNSSEINSIVRDINSKYLYWDKVKYVNRPPYISAEELWAVVKTGRRFNRIHLESESVSCRFTLYITDWMQQQLHQFDMHIGGNLGAEGLIKDEDKQRYLVSSIMEEAIASSQMEGAATTRRQAKEMLRKAIKPRNRSEQMIANNYATIQHIVSNKNDELTPATLLHIHKLITHNTIDNPAEEGAFRDSDDIFVVNHSTSEVVHTPPKSEEISKWIQDLCEFFNEDSPKSEFIHPIVRGIIIHFLIGYIHPFCDGNGRTARALFYWYLLKKGYWLTEYLSISRIIYKSKAQYEKAYLYTELDENDLSYFIQYNLSVMEQAFDSLQQYIQSKIKEQRQTSEFIKIASVNERQAVILKLLSDKPQSVLTIKEIETRFAVSYQTARTDIMGLVELGFVEPIAVNKKKYNYIRSESFETLLENMTKQ